MTETKGALLPGKVNSKHKVEESLVSEESQPKKQQHTNSFLKGRRQLAHMAQGPADTPLPKAEEPTMPVLETSFWQQHDEGYLV